MGDNLDAGPWTKKWPDPESYHWYQPFLFFSSPSANLIEMHKRRSGSVDFGTPYRNLGLTWYLSSIIVQYVQELLSISKSKGLYKNGTDFFDIYRRNWPIRIFMIFWIFFLLFPFFMCLVYITVICTI